MSRLDELSGRKEKVSSIRKILDDKKAKMNLKKVIIKDLKLLNENDDKSRDGYSDREINEQLGYIFDPKSNIKRENEKNKKNNSCKCSRTRCSKFSCNCLRNGVSCDFLCGCKDCDNSKGLGLKYAAEVNLSKKKIRRDSE